MSERVKLGLRILMWIADVLIGKELDHDTRERFEVLRTSLAVLRVPVEESDGASR